MGEEVAQLKGKRHTPEQIVRKLGEADRLQAEGADVDAVCRHLEVSVQTYWTMVAASAGAAVATVLVMLLVIFFPSGAGEDGEEETTEATPALPPAREREEPQG
jgi:hypothetical protein